MAQNAYAVGGALEGLNAGLQNLIRFMSDFRKAKSDEERAKAADAYNQGSLQLDRDRMNADITYRNEDLARRTKADEQNAIYQRGMLALNRARLGGEKPTMDEASARRMALQQVNELIRTLAIGPEEKDRYLREYTDFLMGRTSAPPAIGGSFSPPPAVPMAPQQSSGLPSDMFAPNLSNLPPVQQQPTPQQPTALQRGLLMIPGIGPALSGAASKIPPGASNFIPIIGPYMNTGNPLTLPSPQEQAPGGAVGAGGVPLIPRKR